jgi:predicted RNA-binding Zn-ribbon protein involved in translation (DUF1610 family)
MIRAEDIHVNEKYPCEICGARCGVRTTHRALGTPEAVEADKVVNAGFGYVVYYQMLGGPLKTPIPMRLTCPECGKLHVDEGEFATKVHHTHSCQFCGLTWRPAVEPTVGVRFLPGFKNP